MPPDLHLDPERLHTSAARLTAIVDALVPIPTVDADTRAVMGATAARTVILVELDRMAEELDRACRELASLSAVLHDTATAAAAADVEAASSIARVRWEPS